MSVEEYKLYSIPQFAELMNVAPAFLRKQIKEGKLQTYSGKLNMKLFEKMIPDNENETLNKLELTY